MSYNGEAIALDVNDSPAFRYCGRYLFVTYPQCSLTPEEVLLHFENKWGIKNYCIGQEDHKDNEGQHIHAYFAFASKVDVKNSRGFDIGDFHPHIQVPRNRTHVIEYCKKDGKFISNIDIKHTYQDIFKSATDKASFLNEVKTNFPRDYALNLQRLEYCADILYPANTEEDYVAEYNRFNLPSLLTDWLRCEVLEKYSYCECCDNFNIQPIPNWFSINSVLPVLDSSFEFEIFVN